MNAKNGLKKLAYYGIQGVRYGAMIAGPLILLKAAVTGDYSNSDIGIGVCGPIAAVTTLPKKSTKRVLCLNEDLTDKMKK